MNPPPIIVLPLQQTNNVHVFKNLWYFLQFLSHSAFSICNSYLNKVRLRFDKSKPSWMTCHPARGCVFAETHVFRSWWSIRLLFPFSLTQLQLSFSNRLLDSNKLLSWPESAWQWWRPVRILWACVCAGWTLQKQGDVGDDPQEPTGHCCRPSPLCIPGQAEAGPLLFSSGVMFTPLFGDFEKNSDVIAQVLLI